MGPFSNEERNLDVLRLRYEDQAESLRDMLKLDVQLFIAYMTVQLALGGWIADKSPASGLVRIALGCADFAISWIVFTYFLNSDARRDESTQVIRNINDALKFNAPGIYLADRTINPPPIELPWLKKFRSVFLVGSLISLLAIWGLLLVGPSRNEAGSPQINNFYETYETPSPSSPRDAPPQQGNKRPPTSIKRTTSEKGTPR